MTSALTGSLIFGFVCFILSAVGAIQTVTAVFCGIALMAGWSALMLLLAKPIDGAGL